MAPKDKKTKIGRVMECHRERGEKRRKKGGRLERETTL